MIRIGREIQCLPYAGFLLDNYASVKTNNKYTLFYIRCTKRWRSHYGGGVTFYFLADYKCIILLSKTILVLNHQNMCSFLYKFILDNQN